MLIALLVCALAASQPAPGLPGHWTGHIQATSGAVPIEVDFYPDAGGTLTGVFAQPTQGISESPLAWVTVSGSDIRFKVRGGLLRSRSFRGTLAADGSMTGTFNQTGHGTPLTFTLRRTGDARIPPPVKIEPVPPRLAGVWSGTIGPSAQRLVITIRNRAGGTADGAVLGPGIEVPVSGIRHDGANVIVDARALGGVFEGALDTSATSLSGTWKQQQAAVAITLRKLPDSLAALQGFWLATEIDGQATGDTEAVVAFFGDSYVVIVNGVVDERGTLTIDSAATPAAIDFKIGTGPSAALTQLGIVDVKDGVLRLAFAEPSGSTRPTSFTDARVRFTARKQ